MTNPAGAGLCRSCRHSRRITSRSGSLFWLCGKSETDPGFPRYPVLPVLACSGYWPFQGEVLTDQDPSGD